MLIFCRLGPFTKREKSISEALQKNGFGQDLKLNLMNLSKGAMDASLTDSRFDQKRSEPQGRLLPTH